MFVYNLVNAVAYITQHNTYQSQYNKEYMNHCLIKIIIYLHLSNESYDNCSTFEIKASVTQMLVS